MLKVEEIRAMAPDEMEQKVETLKKDLLTLRVELRMGKLEKHDRIRDIRKSIARLLTILRESGQEVTAPSAQPEVKKVKKEVKKEIALERKTEKKVTKKETAKPAVKKAEKVKK